ncbi:MAG: hypothetical protein AAF485_30190, partial [Chloroflexota bacterium]
NAIWETRYKNPLSYFLRVGVVALISGLLYANFLTLSNYFVDVAYAKSPPWHLYRTYVNQNATPDDVMLTNFPEASVSYYSPNTLPFYVVPDERDLSTEIREQATENIANAYDRIWFLPLLRQGFDEQGDVLNWLDRHADRVDQIFFPVYNINLYVSPTAIDALMIPYPVEFTHDIQLRGYQILNPKGEPRLTPLDDHYLLTVEPEEEFTLSLYWESQTSIPEPYTVFVHLLAADGFNRTGQDNQPVWGSYPTTQWQAGEQITDKYTLTLPTGTPPGDHRLRIGWYHAVTQEPILHLDPSGQPLDNDVILNTIIRVVDSE